MEGGGETAVRCGEVDSACEALHLLQIDPSGSAEPRTGGAAPCSRNVLRKQKHWEKVIMAKKRKRTQERERRKAQQAEGRGTAGHHSKRVLKAIMKERLLEARESGPWLCVDLSMADRMTKKETSRLAAQIRRLYGANRRAEKPFWLCLTEFVVGSLIYEECFRMNDGFSNYLMGTTQESYLDLFPLDTVVYLTPDSENGHGEQQRCLRTGRKPVSLQSSERARRRTRELQASQPHLDPWKVLEDIDPKKVYILGGLVDESIHKKLTLQRARDQSLQTARLPIREYMVKTINTKNYHSETLAINQVFDVLSTYYETRSWPAALKAGVSSGKGYVLPDAVN
ncbi:tRNA methyltransferase 10 homolog B isoform X1 [Dromaius novaehollandiae]|uniref:tRNA methyltransferase 10 homolog B isoform X1 n=1 Tax=Dromaius novaehollandiae TaxID=8790 RepID=UPI00311F4C28